MTDAQKIELIKALAETALELTEDSDTWFKEFWLLRNQIHDILRVIKEG